MAAGNWRNPQAAVQAVQRHVLQLLLFGRGPACKQLHQLMHTSTYMHSWQSRASNSSGHTLELPKDAIQVGSCHFGIKLHHTRLCCIPRDGRQQGWQVALAQHLRDEDASLAREGRQPSKRARRAADTDGAHTLVSWGVLRAGWDKAP